MPLSNGGDKAGRHCHGAPGLRRSRWPGSRTRMKKISYSGYRFPPEIIQQAIWFYLRFTLSLRDVEDLLAERGVAVSYEGNCSGRRLRFQAAQGRGRPSRVRRMASMARIDLRRAVSTTDRISA